MSYVGEIRMFAGNFPPNGWALCDGQLMPISENETLFNLIGTTYGGDGVSTFALPDLRGRLPLHVSSNWPLSAMAGTEAETLTLSQMPAHSHLVGAGGAGSTQSPAGAVVGQGAANLYHPAPSGLNAMHTQALQQVGGSQPHSNLQPFLCIHFIIALFGIFPSQT